MSLEPVRLTADDPPKKRRMPRPPHETIEDYNRRHASESYYRQRSTEEGRERLRQKNRAYHDTLRREAIAAYGGECECCGTRYFVGIVIFL